ncbi:hypothetical protein [Hydrogenivirga sp.]
MKKLALTGAVFALGFMTACGGGGGGTTGGGGGGTVTGMCAVNTTSTGFFISQVFHTNNLEASAAVDMGGSLIILSNSNNSGSDSNVFIGKMDSSGAIVSEKKVRRDDIDSRVGDVYTYLGEVFYHKLSDGVVFGGKSFEIVGFGDVWKSWLVKVDDNLNVMWQKRLRPDISGLGFVPGQNGFTVVLRKSTSSFILGRIGANGNPVCGNSLSGPEGLKYFFTKSAGCPGVAFGDKNTLLTGTDIYYVSTTINGALQRFIGASEYLRLPGTAENLNHAIELSSGGYVLLARMGPDSDGDGYPDDTTTPGGNIDVLVIKLDSSMNIQWARRIGTTDRDEWANQIIEDSDGSLVFVGVTYSTNSYTGDVWLVKLNSSDGSTLWQKAFSRCSKDGYEEGVSLQKLSSTNGFIVSANYMEGSPPRSKTMILRLDENGSLQGGCSSESDASVPNSDIKTSFSKETINTSSWSILPADTSASMEMETTTILDSSISTTTEMLCQ